MKRDRCWARKLDDCCEKLSGEHTVSVNAWPGQNREEKEKTPILVQRGNLRHDGSFDTNVPGGFSREHTVKTATRNILCVCHNNRLSPTDVESGVLTDAILGYWEAVKKRAVPDLPYARKVFRVNGPLIERWFIKSVINYAIGDGLPIGSPDAEPAMPTDELVDIAYGLAKPTGYIGIFGTKVLDEPTNATNDYAHSFLTWQWWNEGDEARPFTAGAVCYYRGLRLVVNLARDVQIPLGNLRQTMPEWADMELVHPLDAFTSASNTNVFIELDWRA